MERLSELMADPAKVSRVTRRGTIYFGSTDVRDLSDGAFPVDVYRCVRMPSGDDAELRATVRMPHRLERETKSAGKGWRAGATAQWVEVRTAFERTNEGKIAALQERYRYQKALAKDARSLAECYEEEQDHADRAAGKLADELDLLGAEPIPLSDDDDWLGMAEQLRAGKAPWQKKARSPKVEQVEPQPGAKVAG